MNQLYTSEEICGLLKISEPTLQRMRKKGCPTVRIADSVRFEYVTVREWCAANPHPSRGGKRPGAGRPKASVAL